MSHAGSRSARIAASVVASAAVLLGLAFPAFAESAPGCGTRGAINGTSGNDVLHGTGGADVICGHGGKDTIYAHGGGDTVYGGSGGDKVYAGSGDDRVAGDSNDDLLYGEDGTDRMYGGTGNDRVYGGSGRDLLKGEDGKDLLKGESGNDAVYGDSGADALYGDADSDLLRGGTGGDALRGGSSNDSLVGESGLDACIGESGSGDLVDDFSCERRASVEALTPQYAPGLMQCGPNDVGCLGFSGYSGKSVAGFPVCDKHNCTNYVAYRLARRGMQSGFPGGNATEWGRRRGVLADVGSRTPLPGDVAHWSSYGGAGNVLAGCGGNCGHVAYVERVAYDAQGAASAIVISESSWCREGKIRSVTKGKSAWPTRFLRWNR